jgi:hypothetical protein
LLSKVAPVLLDYMLSNGVTRDCCLDTACVYDQVTTLMILKELAMGEVATKYLRAFQSVPMNGHGVSAGTADCYGMVWDLDRLTSPLDQHYPLQYLGLIDVARSPAFWGPSDLPMVALLELHSKEIVAELAPLCEPEAQALESSSDHFGPEGVVQNLAGGSWRTWTSLPLFHLGEWNTTACDTVAPLTCSLLKAQMELHGALHSATVPGAAVQMTFVSVYRLRPKSHIHRHVGSQWRLNTHLGLVTPPGAHIRVWNETRKWQVGRAFAFPDSAEHEVVHSGHKNRCVLNVVSWHPVVTQRLRSDAAFASHFANMDAL